MSAASNPPLELVVTVAGSTLTYPLPFSGMVTIGRAEDADIRLKDPSVSRRHAILDMGPPIRIEDLGGANGVRVLTHRRSSGGTDEFTEARVPPRGSVEVAVGTGILLGGTRLLIQRAQQREDTPPTSRVILSFTPPVIEDPRMRELYEMVATRIAQSSINVLLLGETGVGKEVMAESIHRYSPRATKGPLVCLNCAALSESLLESELFGHEAGAFTGAVKAKQGLLETADGGTAFLDEIGELSTSIQVKLLRVLEDQKVLRVGSVTKRKINVRFISATNRDLEAEVERGAFRQDLFYRLNGISLTIPPLRERGAEIEPLAEAFLARAAAQMRRRSPPGLSLPAIEALQRHSWPGNVRELRNVIERALVLCTGDWITPEHLGIGRPSRPSRITMVPHEQTTMPPPPQTLPLRSKKGEDERKRILEVLAMCAGNQTQAAEILGISRRTLVSRLSEYGIERPRKKR